jgi:hypothetical protein
MIPILIYILVHVGQDIVHERGAEARNQHSRLS